MKTNKFKRAIVMLLAITMLLTSTGMASFAESMGEGADKVSTEAVVTESGSDAVQAAAEEAAAEINDEEVPEAAPAESAEPTEEPAEEAVEEAKTELTAKDWEAGLPDKISKDVREAMAQVAKSQLKAEGDLYKAFANAESLDNWDASFVMFVLEYANVLGVSKAIGDESKGTVDKDNISVPVNADTDKWIKALKDKDLFKEISEEAAPEQGDIVFTEDGAAVVIDAEDLTVIGAHNNNVEKFKADADKVFGFVSLKDIAPAEFKDEEQEEEPADEAKTQEEIIAEEQAETEAAAKKEAEAKAEEQKAVSDAEENAVSKGLLRQTINAELVSAPGFGGKLRSFGRALSGADRNTEITLIGMMPEDAYVKAYPVNVEVPGQKVIAAYDITIYTKDENDNEIEWQPETPVNVSIKTDKIAEAAEKASEEASFSVFHMKSAEANPEKVDSVDLGGGEAAFEAETFSIYAITEEEEAVKANYRFWMSKDEAGSSSSTPYRVISVNNGNELLAPADPEDASKGKFVKWHYKDGDAEVTFPVTAEVSGEEDIDIDIYAEFDGAQYATFMSLPTGTSRTVYHTAALTAENNGKYSIDFSTVPEYGAPVGYRFVGWTDQRPTDAKGYGENVAKGNYHKDSITNLDGSVTLFPVCKKVFNVSFNGNGGRVENLPVYKVLATSDDTWSEILSKVNNVARSGYNRDGQWFDGPGSTASQVTFSGDVDLTEDTSYYAHWTPTTTKVTVKYWKEDVDKDAQNNSKYFFMDEEEFTVNTESELTVNKGSMTIGGKTLNFKNILTAHSNGGDKVSGDGTYTSDTDMPYFFVEEVSSVDINGNRYVDAVNAGESTTSKTFTVAEDGSTIVNVWFDRTVYKLRFTFRIYSLLGTARVNYFTGAAHEINTTRGYYDIRLGQDLSGIWPDHTADNLNIDVLGQDNAGWRITSMGKRANSNSYPDAVSVGFSFPLSEVNTELLSEAGADKKIDLWARYEKKLTGGLTASSINEYYEQFGTSDYKRKTARIFRKTTGNERVTAQRARSYAGYDLDVTKTAQNNPAGFDSQTNAATFNNNNAVHFYYNLKEFTVNLNWGKKELATGSDIKYTQPIGAYIKGKTSLKDIYSDPTAAARAEGLPKYMEFKGWYIDEEFTERYEFHEETTMPAHTYSLFARFEPKAVNVSIDNMKTDADETKTNPSLNMAGSELGSGVKKLEYVNPENPTAANPAKYRAHEHTIAEYLPTYWATPVWENHVFKGWQISYDGGDSWEDLKDLNEIVDSSIKLEARWQDMTKHSIHYIEEGKEVYLDTNKYVEGCNVVVKGTDTEIYDKTTQTSRVFRYWLASDGTTQYRPGDIIPMGDSDITLTAVFETGGSSSGSGKATYTFVVPEGADWATYYEEIVYKGERLSPPPINPTKTGATFQGWYKDEACKVKFEGFGNVNAPIDTTIYASFQNPYRVTYKGQEEELITVQNYSGDGTEYLDTSGVGENYSYSSEYAVIGWIDHKTTPGEIPSKYYNGLSEDQVTSNMTMYPVLESGNYLYFVTADDAVQLPAKFYAKSQNLNFTWPDPDEVTREDYTFTGKWYTDAARTNEFNWNTTLSGPTTIYAGWKANEGVDVKSDYTVAWWIEKADSDGDSDNIDNYYYSNSAVVKNVSVSTTQIGANTTISANGNNGAAKNVAHAEKIPQADRNYFEYHMAKVSYAKGLSGDDVVSLSGNGTAPIDKSGKTTLNIFISRARYTVTFNLVESSYWSSSSIGKITYKGVDENETWTLPGGAWFGMPLAGKWPTQGANGNQNPKLTITNGEHYDYWDASIGTDAKTTPVVLDRTNLGDTTNRRVTFTLVTTSNSGSTNVYYRFRDNAQSDYQSTDYNGNNYDQSYDTTSSMKEKDFSGYTYDGKTESGSNYTFKYTRNKWNLNIRDSRTPNNNITTQSLMTGESLNGKVNESDPCAAYNITAPEGMEFDAWSRSAESVVPISFTETSETMPDYDMYVYAHWRTKTATVTYVEEDGTVLSSATKDVNTKFKDFGLKPQSKEGYAFVRWENADTGETINNNMPITENIRVKAVYKSLVSKPVYYDLNGATVNGGAVPIANTTLVEGRYKDNDTYVLGAAVPAKELNTTNVTKPTGTVSFVYWNTEANGSGKIYYPDEVIELPEDKDTVLYAIWAPNMTTTLVYDLNYEGKQDNKSVLINDYTVLQGTQIKVNDDYSVGTEYNDTAKTYVKLVYTVKGDKYGAGGLRPGYKLKGWLDGANPENPVYEDGAPIRTTSYRSDDGSYLESQTLTAVWDEDKIPVELYALEFGEAQKDTERSGDFSSESVDSWTDSEFETDYLSSINSTLPSGYEWAYAKIGGNVVTNIRYNPITITIPIVGWEIIIGYEWQYTTKANPTDNDWQPFVTSGANKTIVKLYYYKNPVEVPVRYFKKDATGALTELNSEDWNVPTGDANTKASIGTDVTSYGKTTGDTKVFASDITGAEDTNLKLHYVGTAIGAKEGNTLEQGVDLADDYFLLNSADGVKHADSADGLDAEGVAVKTGEFAIYVVYEEQPAYLKISNQSEDKDFTFRLKIADGEYSEAVRTPTATVNGTDSETQGEGHYYDFEIGHGTDAIVYIPFGAGLDYEVLLVKDGAVISDPLDESVAWDDVYVSSGTLVAGPLASTTIELPEETDKYKMVVLKDVGKHSLTVTNTIGGKFADMTRTFEVTITLAKKNGSTITAADLARLSIDIEGKAFELSQDKKSASVKVDLGHENSAVATNIPKGWRYSIAEGEHTGYTLTYQTGDADPVAEADAPTGVSLMDDTVVTLNNLYDDDSIVPSGIAKSNMILIPLFLSLVLVLGIVLSIIQRRRLASRTR